MNYPPTSNEVRLHSSLLFERMGFDRVKVYRAFSKRARLYGCKPNPSESTRTCKIFEKAGTALVMYSDGIPVIRGAGGRIPNGDITNELRRLLTDEAVRLGFPAG